MNSLYHSLTIIVWLTLALAFAPPLHADEGAVLLTGDVQLKIANAFMEEGDYYRAITEYKKFQILFPGSEKADYGLFKIGMSYFKGEEYGTAARSFSALREKYPESGYAVHAEYLEGTSYWKLKNYEKAKEKLEALAIQYPKSEDAPRALIVMSLAAFEEGKVEASRLALERVLDRYPNFSDSGQVREAIAQLKQYQELPEKSPALAGILSAILPGSGYFYAGHYGDGITAFLVNGLFIAGTITGIHSENYAVAGIVGGIGVPFYLGNILGSANAAKKWNIGIRNEFTQRIQSILTPLL